MIESKAVCRGRLNRSIGGFSPPSLLLFQAFPLPFASVRYLFTLSPVFPFSLSFGRALMRALSTLPTTAVSVLCVL